jgi:hypothetical protein
MVRARATVARSFPDEPESTRPSRRTTRVEAIPAKPLVVAFAPLGCHTIGVAGATGLARFDGRTTTAGVAMLGRTGGSGEAASVSANVGSREVRE